MEAVRHQRAVAGEIRKASVMTEDELYAYAKEIQAPFHLLKETARLKHLPVVNFAAGGIATPGAQLKLLPSNKLQLMRYFSTAVLLSCVDQKPMPR